MVCIAWVLTAEEDQWHNEGMVLEMKRLIGCKQEDELKYRSLRRHPRKYEALTCLEQAKVGVVIVPVLKERVREAELRDPTTKELAILLHYFPLEIVFNHLGETSSEDEIPRLLMQLVFDQVSWSGFREEIVRRLQQEGYIMRVPPEECVRFHNSKKSLMLQLADIIAGPARDYMESLEGVQLPPCQLCWLKGKPIQPRGCHKKPVGNATLMKVLRPLLLEKNGAVWERGFVVRPPALRYYYWFIDCIPWRK